MEMVYTPVWQDPGVTRSAHQFVQDEIWLMEQVESLGFDLCCSPEHHFDIDYSACPDNFMPLAWLAARTSRIKLCLAAVILPWNDPLRVAEKLAMLDHLSDGRCVAGFGRGLSKMEYAHFGIPMDESRGRFDEALPMVLGALRTGVIQGDGPFYRQVPTPVHPQPRASLADDFCSVGMSPDSATVAGQIGARLLSFITKPTADMMPLFNCYLDAFRAHHPHRTPHIIMDDFYLVRDSADEAFELGMKYTANYYRTVVRHYEFDGDHFAKTKGYTAYAEGAEQLRAAGIDAAAEAYVKCQLGVGSPSQILERLEERFAYLGAEISMAGCFFYGGMTRDEAHTSLKLFSSAVMPQARSMAAAHRQRADAA
ncbi:LLM class flavin-dependent oxidoreductase [Novosphingobium lentum]|uniref:LLM class flavin-dependent oxidoreductase n=1 Tax=Novosphingobium lentum TaxID=145287 RepID=UPI00082AE732|nr:LLM class flavin-dependent oxidoreductase [Novosphingobium lentum]